MLVRRLEFDVTLFLSLQAAVVRLSLKGRRYSSCARRRRCSSSRFVLDTFRGSSPHRVQSASKGWCGVGRGWEAQGGNGVG